MFIPIFKNKFAYIFVIDEASDFKFSKPVGKAHHRRKVGVALV